MRKVVGNQWSLMRKYLVGRSDNAIKNRFNAAERCKGIKVKKPKAIDNNDEQSLDSESLEKANFDMDMDKINVNRFDTDKTATFTEDDFSGLNDSDFDNLFTDDFNFDFIDDAKMATNQKSSSSSNAWDCDGCSTIKQSVNNFLKPKLDIVEKDTKDRLL